MSGSVAAPRAQARARPLLRTPLVVVTGKGGVGKSTVAAALALSAARRGRRPLVVEVGGRHDAQHALGGAPVRRVTLEPDRALRDYVGAQLPPPLGAVLLHNRLFTLLTEATPGLAELLTVGEVWELARPRGRRRRHGAHDVVILDAPATGHVLGLLEAPGAFAEATAHGPIAHQAAGIDAFLRDPRATTVLAVVAAEELAVNETLQLADRLDAGLGMRLERIIVNGVWPDRFRAADVAALRRAGDCPARRAALRCAARADAQRAELTRLAAALPGVAQTQLGFVFGTAAPPAVARRLARELAP